MFISYNQIKKNHQKTKGKKLSLEFRSKCSAAEFGKFMAKLTAKIKNARYEQIEKAYNEQMDFKKFNFWQ